MLKALIEKNRSYRRFVQSEAIKTEQLCEWVELARLSPSGRNAQPLKYVLINDVKDCGEVFPHLTWAGYLTDWDGPAEGERPAAYIVVLKDLNISKSHFCDDGIAMQSILLGAVEAGYGGCIFGSVQREALREALSIDENFEILYVLALGKPAEEVVIEPMKEGDIKYWRDAAGVHHVPKRSPDEIIVK